MEEIFVRGVAYRSRIEGVAPVLTYDLDFQRFEPLTVGDMLKRTPSVAFLSDVLEYDGARLHGLDRGRPGMARCECAGPPRCGPAGSTRSNARPSGHGPVVQLIVHAAF